VSARSRTILLNLLPLKTGGGVQVALDLLEQIGRDSKGHRWAAIARSGSPFEQARYRRGLSSLITVPDNLLARSVTELFYGTFLASRLKVDVIYTVFGPHLMWARKPQVVGCAYSNLFYPEVDFWKGLPPAARLRRELIDRYRLWRARHADLLLVETAQIAERAVAIRGFNPGRVRYLKPAVSSLVSGNGGHPETAERVSVVGNGFTVLSLSGYHPNKNLTVVPEVLKCLEINYGITDVNFLMTMQDSPGTSRLLEEARRLGVIDRIHNIGPIPHAGCVEAYSRANAVLVTSRLESFTNNVPEAWEMRRPLIMPDLDWARGICGDAALYAGFNKPADIAEAIVRLRNDPELVQRLTEEGSRTLGTYPSSPERFSLLVEILLEASET
jgi:glycosyltransferase involved in cell wall biosynthesis